MARGKSWADDSTTQIKFAGGGSLSIAFRGNLFDLLPNERALITTLSEHDSGVQQNQSSFGSEREQMTEKTVMHEVKVA